MIEPSFELQQAIRNRIVNFDDGQLSDYGIEPNNVFDGQTRPDTCPCVIIGEGQSVLESVTYSRKHARLFMSLHVWTEGEGLHKIKTISEVIRRAMAHVSPDDFREHRLVDFKVSGARYMRELGTYGHAIVNVEALLELAE